MGIWLRLTWTSIYLSWFLLLCIWRTWSRVLRRNTFLLPFVSSFSFWTPSAQAGFILKICSLRLFWLSSISWGRRDILRRIWGRIGFLFSIRLDCTKGLWSWIPIRIICWKRMICLNIPRDSPTLWLTVFLRSTPQLMEKWITKAFYSSCWLWTTRKLLRLFNIFGGFWMFITREPLILSSSTCFSGRSSKSWRLWRNVGSMWRILRTRYSIWLSLSCRWR